MRIFKTFGPNWLFWRGKSRHTLAAEAARNRVRVREARRAFRRF